MVWHEAPFAVGANLQQVGEACTAGAFDLLEATVEKFQRASQTGNTPRFPPSPRSRAGPGGLLQFVMHAGKRVMALESYVGLVEAGSA